MAIGDAKVCKCTKKYVQRWKKQSQCPECRAATLKAWRKNNPQRAAAGVHARAKRARAEGRMTLRLYMSTLAHAIKGYRRKKTDRVLEFDLDGPFLTALWEEQGGKCAASGLPMVHQVKSLCSASVDRLDNTGGYTKGNVRLVCKWANLGRNNHTVEEFQEVITSLRGR